MNFPDWSTAINSNVQAFLNSPNIAGPVAALIAISVGAAMVTMVMAIFLRGR